MAIETLTGYGRLCPELDGMAICDQHSQSYSRGRFPPNVEKTEVVFDQVLLPQQALFLQFFLAAITLRRL